jgi:ABC-2 type transport system ATP-binding protein
VKLAQALVHDPELIFLDEPTNGLDPAGRDEMLRLIRRIGTDFGISVLVTSHLLGELERIADHVVVIDSGRLLRSSEIEAYTRATQLLTVEVTDGTHDDGTDALAGRLAGAGLAVRRDGHRLEVQIGDEDTFDHIRDAAAELGVGLIRLQQRRHRIEEVFTEAPSVG